MADNVKHLSHRMRVSGESNTEQLPLTRRRALGSEFSVFDDKHVRHLYHRLMQPVAAEELR
jgi:hypothetical protein